MYIDVYLYFRIAHMVYCRYQVPTLGEVQAILQYFITFNFCARIIQIYHNTVQFFIIYYPICVFSGDLSYLTYTQREDAAFTLKRLICETVSAKVLTSLIRTLV